ncbi:FliH/SctL family protein [Euzebya rosea]|uniref:FliH/SctL family protein n=1 Tax=Euzebya rosea TaxID=2052804 RepID=UPI000D3EB603|nr:FliH/SctL family protein [Euzebya rosea]
MSSSSDRAPRVGILRGAVAGRPAVVPAMSDPRRPRGVPQVDAAALAALHEQAQREGWQAGYEAGLAAGQQDAHDRAAEAEQRHRAALDALLGAVADLRHREVASLEHVADQTALLALRIAEIVLEREITSASDPGRDAIARAIDLVPEEGDVRIRMNPADIQAMGQVEDLMPGRGVELIADPTVTSGGCVVNVDATRIDAQIPTALGRVAEVLR